jgi:hypothetical protein
MTRYVFIILLIATQICVGQNNSVSYGWTIKNPFDHKNFIKNEGQCDFDNNSNSNCNIYFDAYSQDIHYYLCDKGIIIWK